MAHDCNIMHEVAQRDILDAVEDNKEQDLKGRCQDRAGALCKIG